MLHFLRKSIPDTHPIRLLYHKLLAMMAAMWFGFPGKKLKVICVTGTNGKTTTVNLIAQLFTHAGKKVGMMSTMNFQIGDRVWTNETKQTTQSAFGLQKMLRLMLDEGCTHAVIETSSHAMTQSRLWGVSVDTAVFTNLSSEHENYHGSFEKYMHAKGMLFNMLNHVARKPGIQKVSIVNKDDPNASYFEHFFADRKMSFGMGSGSCYATNIELSPDGTRFTLHVPNDKLEVDFHLVGKFNVYNALAAATVVLSEGVSLVVVKDGLEKVRPIPGRLQLVQEGQSQNIVVDYGHTPKAFESLLPMYRELTKGKLFVVFGITGGGRDRAKGKIMAEWADKCADYVIVTDDDPYSDDEMELIEAVAVGMDRQEGDRFWKIPNRREAIRLALSLTGVDDTVLILGKGSETVMLVHGERRKWNDVDVVTELLKEEMRVSL